MEKEGLGFKLVENLLSSPRTKRYGIDVTQEDIESALMALAAFEGDRMIGFTIVNREAWNRRARVHEFYISSESRGKGRGRKLMEEVIRRAESSGMRTLWVETQNTNHPAIQFYQRMGFEFCGLDCSLYDAPSNDEIAIFLNREIEKK